jgi:glycosyltransferase involved in cell wall biosynthesis
MVGAPPNAALQKAAHELSNDGTVRFLTGLTDDQVRAVQFGGLVHFPHLEEGFGWPIAESMACGTPVLTTDAAPMTEVGGDAAFYHRRWTADDSFWAADGAKIIESILSMNEVQRTACVEKSLAQASQFSTDRAIDQYEAVYKAVNLTKGHRSFRASIATKTVHSKPFV